MMHHQHISKFGLPSFTQTSLTAFFIIFLHADGRLFFGASSVRFVRSVLESGEVLGNKIAGTGSPLALRGGQPRDMLDCQIGCVSPGVEPFFLVSTMCIYIYIYIIHISCQ